MGRIKKTSIYLVFLLFICNLFVREQSFAKDSHIDFGGLAAQEEMCLIVYYVHLNAFTRAPFSKDDMKNKYNYKITVNPLELWSYSNKFEVINLMKFTKAKESEYDYMNLRIYCEFRTPKKIILSIGLDGDPRIIMINDKICKSNKSLYELYEALTPFIPSCDADYYKKFLKNPDFIER